MSFKKVSNQEKSDNIQRACTSLLENYLPIFLPYERLKSNNLIFKEFEKNGQILKRKTKYGELEIRNRLLTQVHKDILESILLNKKIAIKSEDCFAIEVQSAYHLLKILGKTYKQDYLIERIKEIQDMTIYTKYNTNQGEIQESFKIISQIKIEEALKGKAKKIKIKFTKEFSAFYTDNSLADYREKIKLIAHLPTAFLKSIARYMLLHKSHQINIDTFTKNLGYDTLFSEKLLYVKKREIKKYQKNLKKLGIEVIESKLNKSNTLKINQEKENPILIQNYKKLQKTFNL